METANVATQTASLNGSAIIMGTHTAQGTVKRGDSAKLAQNMESANMGKRPNCMAAHHIVAGDDKRADEARQILDTYNIDVNSAMNGVYLPHASDNCDGSGSAYHRSVHTDQYYERVNELLREAVAGLDEVQAVRAINATLNMIRTNLMQGIVNF